MKRIAGLFPSLLLFVPAVGCDLTDRGENPSSRQGTRPRRAASTDPRWALHAGLLARYVADGREIDAIVPSRDEPTSENTALPTTKRGKILAQTRLVFEMPGGAEIDDEPRAPQERAHVYACGRMPTVSG